MNLLHILILMQGEYRMDIIPSFHHTCCHLTCTILYTNIFKSKELSSNYKWCTFQSGVTNRQHTVFTNLLSHVKKSKCNCKCNCEYLKTKRVSLKEATTPTPSLLFWMTNLTVSCTSSDISLHPRSLNCGNVPTK